MQMTLSDFRSKFPHLTTIDTGGGCTALYMAISGDRYILLSDDNCRVPTDASVGDDSEPHINIALYADTDGSNIGGHDADDFNFVTLSDAVMLIESWDADASWPLHPDHDPTPWCGYCGAKQPQHCHCGPIAENN